MRIYTQRAAPGLHKAKREGFKNFFTLLLQPKMGLYTSWGGITAHKSSSRWNIIYGHASKCGGFAQKSSSRCRNIICGHAWNCVSQYLYDHWSRNFWKTHFQIYIPSTLAVFIAWFSFCIELTSLPARICSGICAILAILLLYSNIMNLVPRAGYVVGLDIWILICIVFVFLSICESAYLCSLKRKYMDKDELGFKCLKVDYLSRVLFIALFLLCAACYFGVSIFLWLNLSRIF